MAVTSLPVDGGLPAGVRLLTLPTTLTPPPLILDRIDPEGHTILFGPGGAGKGCLVVSWIVRLTNQGKSVLVVDFEGHADEWARRVAGLGGDPDRVEYCSPMKPGWPGAYGPLWSDENRGLLRAAVDGRVDLVVIDSINDASVGADISLAMTASNYAGAVQYLGVPVVSLGHVAKSGESEYPFGSVYWHNQARTTWSLDGNRKLTHRKRNNYATLGSFNVELDFRNDVLRGVVERAPVPGVAKQIALVIPTAQATATEVVALVQEAASREGWPYRKADTISRELRQGWRVVNGAWVAK